nr:hypothetical protein [Tanacetum cinerariifolium]
MSASVPTESNNKSKAQVKKMVLHQRLPMCQRERPKAQVKELSEKETYDEDEEHSNKELRTKDEAHDDEYVHDDNEKHDDADEEMNDDENTDEVKDDQVMDDAEKADSDKSKEKKDDIRQAEDDKAIDDQVSALISMTYKEKPELPPSSSSLSLSSNYESYQKKLNITKPQQDFPGISCKESYTTSYDPKGVVYLDSRDRKRLMRVDELYNPVCS